MLLLSMMTACGEQVQESQVEQASWYQNGRVVDLRDASGPNGSFTSEFNNKSVQSGHNVYLLLMGEDQLQGRWYTDEVGLAVMDGDYHPDLASSNSNTWLPDDAVIISIAPSVAEDTTSYEFAISSLNHRGVYERLGQEIFGGDDEVIAVEIANEIEDDVVNGKWQEGALRGIELIAEASNELGIQPPNSPRIQTQPQPQPSPQQPPVIVQREPVDLSGLFVFLTRVLLLIALGVAVWFAWRVFERYQEDRQRREAAQANAISVRDKVVNYLNDAENKIDMAEVAMKGILKNFPKASQTFIRDMEMIRESYDNALTMKGNLPPQNDPDQKGLTVGDYTRIAGNFQQILDELMEGEALLNAMNSRAATLHTRLEATKLDISTADEELAMLEETIGEADEVMDIIRSDFAPSNWSLVERNSERARENLATAQSKLKTAKVHYVDNNDAEEAENLLQEMRKAAEEAGWLCESIVELHNNIVEARDTVDNQLKQITTEIEEAIKFVEAHDEDLPESYETQLDQAHNSLGQALQLLGLDRPDYLEVQRLIREADHACDSILDQAQDMVRSLERAERQSESDLQQARVSVQQFENFIDDNRKHVGLTPHAVMGRLSEQMKVAQSSYDLALNPNIAEGSERLEILRRISNDADAIERRAKQALEEAKDEVKEATQPRTYESYSYVPSYSVPSSSPRRTDPGYVGSSTWSSSPSRSSSDNSTSSSSRSSGSSGSRSSTSSYRSSTSSSSSSSSSRSSSSRSSSPSRSSSSSSRSSSSRSSSSRASGGRRK